MVGGRAESFRPTTTRRSEGPCFVVMSRSCWREVMVSKAKDSMFEPIVADQREMRRSREVQADQMARVWARKRGSRRTSASSRTRLLTLGREYVEVELSVMALTKSRGVVTRMSLL